MKMKSIEMLSTLFDLIVFCADYLANPKFVGVILIIMNSLFL